MKFFDDTLGKGGDINKVLETETEDYTCSFWNLEPIERESGTIVYFPTLCTCTSIKKFVLNRLKMTIFTISSYKRCTLSKILEDQKFIFITRHVSIYSLSKLQKTTFSLKPVYINLFTYGNLVRAYESRRVTRNNPPSSLSNSDPVM